jgi:hypothetical protein
LTEELEAVLNAWMEAAKNQEKHYKTAWKHEDVTKSRCSIVIATFGFIGIK